MSDELIAEVERQMAVLVEAFPFIELRPIPKLAALCREQGERIKCLKKIVFQFLAESDGCYCGTARVDQFEAKCAICNAASILRPQEPDHAAE